MVDVEGLAISALDDRLGYIERIKTHTTKRDTLPIWDGSINVYRDKSQKKDALIKAVPVQVKGDTTKSIKKNTIYYPVDVADLKGFMTTDGAIYFVVGIDKQKRNKKIYYASLLPIKIDGLLKNVSDPQKTRNVQLKVLPENDDEILDIFLNFIRDSNKQSNVKEIGVMSLTDLQSKKQVHHLECGYATVRKNFGISDMLGREMCLYAVDAVGISHPLDEAVLERVKNEIPQKVSCDGKVYYDKITITQTADDLSVSLGKGLLISYIRPQEGKYNKIRIEFDEQGTVKERLHDINFFIALAERQDIYLDDGLLIKLPDDFELETDLNVVKHHKKYLEILAQAMDLAGIPDNRLSFDDLDKDNCKLANVLIRAFIKKEPALVTPIPEEDVSFGLLNMEELKLMVVAKRVAGETFEIENFFTADLGSVISDLNHKEYPSSRYVLLQRDHFLYGCNINYDDLYVDVIKVRMNPFHFHRVTLLILEMLKAYDINKDVKLLNVSERLAIWLLDNDSEENKNIAVINLIQIKKRKGTITEEDIKSILNILASNIDDQCKAACWILLDMPDNAQKIIDTMDDDKKNTFERYPIYHLLEKHS